MGTQKQRAKPAIAQTFLLASFMILGSVAHASSVGSECSSADGRVQMSYGQIQLVNGSPDGEEQHCQDFNGQNQCWMQDKYKDVYLSEGDGLLDLQKTELAKLKEWDNGRDRTIDHVVEVKFRIDPKMADQLTDRWSYRARSGDEISKLLICYDYWFSAPVMMEAPPEPAQ